jgi:hypothetical protein
VPAKGQLDAVKAVKVLVDMGRDVRLRIFGWGSREALDQVQGRIRALGLTGLVTLEGHRRDAVEQLATCDAVAIPSWAEGFGRVAVEAAAVGVPVVYAATGGTNDFMTAEVTGLAVQPKDPEGLAAALARLMDDRELSRRLVAAARGQVRSWLVGHQASDALEAIADTLPRRDAARASERLVTDMVLRDARDVVERTRALDRGTVAQLVSPAATQGARVRGERLSRLLAQWIGRRGTRRNLLPRGAAAAAGVLGKPLPRRVRVAALVAALDPAMDSLVVERLVDPDWYRGEYGVSPDRDSVVEFARTGLRAGHRPNEFVDPDWYLLTYPDVAEAGIPAVQHYLADGCFEGRSPGPSFDPDQYLAANPDVASSPLLPLEHYLLFGREEGRTW